MSEVVKLKITKAGLYAFFDARSNGIRLELSTMKYSSANFESVLMDERTSLPDIVSESHIVASGTSVETNTIRFITLINSASDLYIGSVGVYTAEGVLFAVASVPTGQLFRVYTGISFTATFGLSITAQVLENINVVVDQNTPIMYSMMLDHENHANPHPQYAKSAEVTDAIKDILKELDQITEGQSDIGGQMVGVGQDYVNVAGQRVSNGTVYINNSNKPIEVLVQMHMSDGESPMVINVNGKTLFDLYGHMLKGTLYLQIPITFMVQPFKGYSISGGTILRIHELK